MVGAELLKLRRRRSIIALATFFTVGIVALYFGVKAIQHAADPSRYGPAGGLHNYDRAIELLSVFFGTLAAILDRNRGGRVRPLQRRLPRHRRHRPLAPVALRGARPGSACGQLGDRAGAPSALSLAATYGLAGGQPTPGGSFVVDSVLWVLAAQGVICAVAVGLGSLTGSRATSLVTLIGWQVIAGRLLVQVSFLGGVRDLIPNVALGALKPGDALPDTNGLTMGAGVAVAILAIWAIAWLGRRRLADAHAGRIAAPPPRSPRKVRAMVELAAPLLGAGRRVDRRARRVPAR